MKTAFKGPSGTVTYRDIALRQLAPDEIRLKIDACGICGTDLHHNPAESAESRFGHEIAGTIIELGSAVKGLGLGQKVALDSSTPCGSCAACKNGEQELCTGVRSFFNHGELGFAEETIAPAISALPYNGITAAVASLQEPLGVAIDMVRLSDINLNSRVLIMGAGPIGLMALALAKRQGAERVFVCQRRRRSVRCRIAEEWGAEAIIAPEELESYDFAGRIDRIMVTTPPDTLEIATKIACKGGIITFIGLGFGDQGRASFDGNDFHFKKLQLRASFASPALFGPMAVAYLENGVIDGERLISHTCSLDELESGMKTASSDPAAVKVVMVSP